MQLVSVKFRTEWTVDIFSDSKQNGCREVLEIRVQPKKCEAGQDVGDRKRAPFETDLERVLAEVCVSVCACEEKPTTLRDSMRTRAA